MFPCRKLNVKAIATSTSRSNVYKALAARRIRAKESQKDGDC